MTEKPKNPKAERHELYGGKVVIDFLPDSHQYWLVKDGKDLPRKKRLGGVTSTTGLLGGKQKIDGLIKWAVGECISKVVELLKLSEEGLQYTAQEILSALEVGRTAPDETKEKAAGVGDYVHRFAEEYMKDLNAKAAYARVVKELGTPMEDEKKKIDVAVTALVDWIVKEGLDILSAESIIYSRKLGYTGRYDAIVDHDGKKYLTDYKTGSGIYNDHYYQLSAYLRAYEEEHGANTLDGALIVNVVKEDKEKNGVIVRRAGDIITEFRSRGDLVKDYKAFKGLDTVKSREKELTAEWFKKNKK